MGKDRPLVIIKGVWHVIIIDIAETSGPGVNPPSGPGMGPPPGGPGMGPPPGMNFPPGFDMSNISGLMSNPAFMNLVRCQPIILHDHVITVISHSLIFPHDQIVTISDLLLNKTNCA